MKKLLGILVLGLLWCNVGFAGILPDASPSEQYEFATEYLKVGDYENAEKAFKEFVDKNPNHELAGSAQYWYAETFRARKLYKEAAIAYFVGNQKYPKSEKAPINLLKLGVVLTFTGERDHGCEIIDSVKLQYPNANKSVLEKAKFEYGSLCKSQVLGLTSSEEDVLKNQLFSCWSIPLGLPKNKDLLVRVKLKLKRDGTVLKTEIIDHERMSTPGQGFYKVLVESVLRAIQLCQPLKVPTSGYERWKDLQLNFDAIEMVKD